MIKNKYFKKITSAIGCAALVATCVVSSNASAKLHDENKITSNNIFTGTMTYGYAYVTGKFFCTFADTTKPVARIRAYEVVQITSSGKEVDHDNTAWIPNSKNATVECDLIHANKNGYKNTPLTAYGTGDAITIKAYEVHVSAIF